MAAWRYEISLLVLNTQRENSYLRATLYEVPDAKLCYPNSQDLERFSFECRGTKTKVTLTNN